MESTVQALQEQQSQQAAEHERVAKQLAAKLGEMERHSQRLQKQANAGDSCGQAYPVSSPIFPPPLTRRHLTRTRTRLPACLGLFPV
jgi:hypothetical protein